MALKPNWSAYYRLGVDLSKHLEGVSTFAEIGVELGVSKQRAYHECMVALGKLAYGLKRQLGSADQHGFGSS